MPRDQWELHRSINGLHLRAVWTYIDTEEVYAWIGYVGDKVADLQKVIDPYEHSLRFIAERVMMTDPIPARTERPNEYARRKD